MLEVNKIKNAYIQVISYLEYISYYNYHNVSNYIDTDDKNVLMIKSRN